MNTCEINKFENYLIVLKEKNIHNKLNKIINQLPDNIKTLNNIILYGISGIGKYTQSLKIISKYSQSTLKYEKKITVVYNKKQYFIKISDIHYEVDFSLLGCNAKMLWNNIYKNIVDIINTTKHKTGIILCKNFHLINNELLDIFYSFMQKNPFHNIIIKFIFLTEQISFIPKNIIDSCITIRYSKPSKYKYCTCLNLKKLENYDTIENLKNLQDNINVFNNIFVKNCDNILYYINNYNTINILQLRDYLYNIFIYQLDLNKSIWYIISKLIETKKINSNNIFSVFKTIFLFFRYYNNNYRPIYHLENFIINLIRNIYEF